MTAYTLKLKFQKVDKYGGSVFSINTDENKETYDALVALYDKIEALNYGTRNPIYNNQKYKFLNITFKNCEDKKLKPRHMYQLTFSITKREYGGRLFTNPYLDKIEYAGPPETPKGEVLAL